MASQIRFTLTEQDHVDAARAQYRKRVTSLRSWRWTLPILLLWGSFLAYSDSDDLESLAYRLVVYVGLIIVVALAMIGLCYVTLAGRARRLFRQQVVHPESLISWDEEGLRSENRFGTFAAHWSDFYGWRRTAGAFTILFNEGYFFLIPERALTPVQASDLQSVLERSGLSRR